MALDSDAFVVVDPSTGKEVARYPLATASETSAALIQLKAQQNHWRSLSLTERAEAIRTLGPRLLARKSEFATHITKEMGKPLDQAVAEIEKCALLCDYCAEEGVKALKFQPISTSATLSGFAPVPLGIILGIMPWNFPVWQALRFALPNLMAGNGVLVKHAPNVAGCAEKIPAVLAGLPFANIRLSIEQTQTLIADPAIAGVSVTGSVRAGRAVAQTAASHLKKAVLELGGDDAFLILADADLDVAAQAVVASRMGNSGQSCVSAKRVLVHRDVYDGFKARITKLLEQQVVGDPAQSKTTVGPIARSDLKAQLEQQIARLTAEGSKITWQSGAPNTGNFFPITLIENFTESSSLHWEELFGPVLCLMRCDSELEMIRIANSSPFGLGGAVFSEDLPRARRIAEEDIEVGFVAINDFVRSDPRLPFGGVKLSGYGRELGPTAFLEFCNIKTLYQK